MADYFTQEVVTEPVLLTPIMEEVLALRGAECWPDGDETVLDHIVNGVQASLFAVVFESGWSSEEPDELLDWREPDLDHLSEEDRAEFDRLLALSKERFFREVLKINPEQEYIELQAGWSCSKLRLDGFGGSGLFVSKKGYHYVTTSNVGVTDDGEFHLLSAFTPWDQEDRDAEAA